MNIKAIWIILLCLVLIACSPVITPTAEGHQSVPLSQTSISGGYPAQENTANGSNSGYPSDLSNILETIYPEAITIPTPGEGTGIVTGKLVTKSNPTEAYLAPELLLSKIIKSTEPDVPPLVRIHVGQDPVAVQDLSGNFYFSDVPPGEYALVIASPMASILVTDLDSGQMHSVTVVTGEVHDLGEIKVQ